MAETHIENPKPVWKSQVTYRPSCTALKRSPDFPGSGALCIRKATAPGGCNSLQPDLRADSQRSKRQSTMNTTYNPQAGAEQARITATQ